MSHNATAEPKGTIRAVVIRKDGTREDLGVVASTEDGTMAVTAPPRGLKERVMRLVKKESTDG